MEKSRFFILISYAQEDTLIDFFALTEKYFEKYDFFSQDIRVRGSLVNEINPERKIRIVSFPRLYSPEKFIVLSQKLGKLINRLASKGHRHFDIKYGYANVDQIVSLHSKKLPDRIYLGKKLYARVESVFIEQKQINYAATESELNLPEVKKYFADLQRLFRHSPKR